MALVFAFLLSFLSLSGELLCGSLGAAPPFLAITVFYLAKQNSAAMGIFTAVFWGLVKDLTLGRDFLFTPFELLLLLGILLTIYRKPCTRLPEVLPAGAITGACITLAHALCSGIYGEFRPGSELLAALFFNTAVCTLWMPVQLMLWDYPARRMKLATFFRPEKNQGGNRHRRVSSRSIHPGDRP